MSGLFGENVCSSLFFQMEADTYYATDTQDKYGALNKKWSFDSENPCSLYTMGDKSNTKSFTFEDKKFFKLETMLYGRFAKDPRKDSVGTYHPVSHILITNIKAETCNTEVFFIETNGDYVGSPTVFEIKTIQPFIGPFNTIEYYKVQLERSDIQGVNQNDTC